MLEQLFNLKRKKALITGGSVGIGRACAMALASCGADVAIAGRTEESARKTCNSLRELGVEAFFCQCDVTEEEQIDLMMEEVCRRFGRIDIAINNAGGSGYSSALAMDRLEWTRTIDVNLTGLFWCAQAEAKRMVSQTPAGGKIINMASMYATVAGGTCAYNASKAAVVHLTRSLASEWGSYNINVNCISPGWTLTRGNPIGSELRQRMRQVTPAGSLMRYEDIYGAVVFLSSASSDFITGHDLVVDGGHSINTWLTPVERAVLARTTPEDEEAGLKNDLS